MEGTDGTYKTRAVSSTSSSSSVTEYVNEIFEDSELESSKVVSIQVTNDIQWLKNPLEDDNSLKKIGTMTNAKGGEKTLQDFSEISSPVDASYEFIPRGFRKMYLAALVVLLFAVCMGVTGTYSATATADMKKAHSSIHPNLDEESWIGSLMPVGALIGGSAGVIIPRLLIFLSVLIALCVNTSSSSVKDQYLSKNSPSLRERTLLLQKVFDENLSRLREAGLKRDRIPSGFVGVRGRKSDKAMAKEPVPGFVGVRGKKSNQESIFHEAANRRREAIPESVTRYHAKEHFKLRRD